MTDTNLHARKQIARKWPTLSDDERQQLRSLWSRAGVVCEICGLVGYYREICPKQCKLPKRKIFDSDSDSDEDEQDGKDKGPLLNKGGLQGSSSSTMVAGYVNDTGLGILWGQASQASQSSSTKRQKNAASSLTLTRKQQHLADMRPNALAEKVTLNHAITPLCSYATKPPCHHLLSIPSVPLFHTYSHPFITRCQYLTPLIHPLNPPLMSHAPPTLSMPE